MKSRFKSKYRDKSRKRADCLVGEQTTGGAGGREGNGVNMLESALYTCVKMPHFSVTNIHS